MTDQLGTLLRRLRIQSGLTQEQLSERSEVSVRTIRRLETNKSTDHRLGTIERLAAALEVGPEDHQRLMATLANPPESDPGPGERVPSPVPVPASAPVRDALTDAAQELAREVRRRWRREEEQRQVHDPFPLPVRWEQALAPLTDLPQNFQLLEPGAALPPVQLSGELRDVTEIYRRIPSGRLVVLGRAGSGKSILAIRFLLEFPKTPSLPQRAPVIFSVGSWDPTTTALRDWLIGLLLRDHPHLARRVPTGATLAAALVDADLILPVLDGFDEIAVGLRQSALGELNKTSLPLVLTSRRAEYEEAVTQAEAPLVLAAGIQIADLAHHDLAAYLPRTARPAANRDGAAETAWEGVLEKLRTRETAASLNLARVLTTPLMVALARTMYNGAPDRHPKELLKSTRFSTEIEIEQHLLAGFVPTVYQNQVPERIDSGRRHRRRTWDPQRAELWLGYLADHMARLDNDQQDLAWWQIGDTLRRSTRILIVVLVSALCVTVAESLANLLTNRIGQSRIGLTPMGLSQTVLDGPLIGMIGGLGFGAIYAVMIVFGGGTFKPAHVRLRLPRAHDRIARRPLRTFSTRFVTMMLGGIVIGTGYALALALERSLYDGLPLMNGEVIKGSLINVLVLGVMFGLALGPVFGLMAVLEAPLDDTAAATPAGLLSANRAIVSRQLLILVPMITLVITFGGRLVVDALNPFLGPLTWSMPTALVIGGVSGIGGGFGYVLCFTAWGRWLVLSRLWLPLTGRLPWDTAAFLDDAYQRGVLRQTGAVYQFRHIRLQHHLGHAFRRQSPNYKAATFTTPGTAAADPTAHETPLVPPSQRH